MPEPLITPSQPRTPKTSKGQDVQGWLVLHKESGITSAHAVALVKRIFNAKKAGHAGTLDPLADGVLPIAFGKSTKTITSVVDTEKVYRFTVSWGTQTDTDDSEGKPIAHASQRPTRQQVEKAIEPFLGAIEQVPPAFSALKINGQRAYARARQGETVILPPRPVTVYSFTLLDHRTDHSLFEVLCSKGTYVRSLARDLGESLGCLGHVSALSRMSVGKFHHSDALSLSHLRALKQTSEQDLLSTLRLNA
jgi:tRNA pseudouridine55 synthase